MQESRYDGDVVLTDRATQEQIEKAMGDPRNKTVALHKPGSEVQLPNGDRYVAQADGSWARLKDRATADERARLHELEARLRAAEAEGT